MKHSVLFYIVRALLFVPIAVAIVAFASVLAPLYVVVLIIGRATGHDVRFACKRVAR